jgi:hypothetical protein
MGNKRLPFRVEMARAWHEERKTVTRRIVKPQPEIGADPAFPNTSVFRVVEDKKRPWVTRCLGLNEFAESYAPYAPGSTVIIAEPLVNVGGIVAYASDRSILKAYHGGTEVETTNGVYCATADEVYLWKWKVNRLHSRYMPNWAARSWARIVSVRVERLQEITEEDARREGIEAAIWDQAYVTRNYAKPDAWFQTWTEDEGDYVPFEEADRASYRSLIDAINGPGTWQANPWVFRYELEKLAEAPHE